MDKAVRILKFLHKPAVGSDVFYHKIQRISQMPQQAGIHTHKKPFCCQLHPEPPPGHPYDLQQSKGTLLSQAVECLDIQLDQHQDQEDTDPADPDMEQGLYGLLTVCRIPFPVIIKIQVIVRR